MPKTQMPDSDDENATCSTGRAEVKSAMNACVSSSRFGRFGLAGAREFIDPAQEFTMLLFLHVAGREAIDDIPFQVQIKLFKRPIRLPRVHELIDEAELRDDARAIPGHVFLPLIGLEADGDELEMRGVRDVGRHIADVFEMKPRRIDIDRRDVAEAERVVSRLIFRVEVGRWLA